jgi:hypothetical protein
VCVTGDASVVGCTCLRVLSTSTESGKKIIRRNFSGSVCASLRYLVIDGI